MSLFSAAILVPKGSRIYKPCTRRIPLSPVSNLGQARQIQIYGPRKNAIGIEDAVRSVTVVSRCTLLNSGLGEKTFLSMKLNVYWYEPLAKTEVTVEDLKVLAVQRAKSRIANRSRSRFNGEFRSIEKPHINDIDIDRDACSAR